MKLPRSIAAGILVVGLAAEVRADEPGAVLKRVLNALANFAGFLKTIAEEGVLHEQSVAQKGIADTLTKVAFPFPEDDPRPGVLGPIGILLGEVRSLATEFADLDVDKGWAWSARTELIRRVRIADQDVVLDRAGMEAIFGAPARGDLDREQLTSLVGLLSEGIVKSHVQASGQWATILPSIEKASATGARATPGDALRDAAWLAAESGRMAQHNSSMQSQRLAIEALEIGRELQDTRLADAAGFSAYAAFACAVAPCKAGAAR